MKTKTIFLAAIIFVLLSFTGDNNEIEFNYPKNKDAVFTMTTQLFKKFKKEWRGEDYYYICENGDNNFICSVLFYKLNKDEVKDLHKVEKASGVPKGSPVYPLSHFSAPQKPKNTKRVKKPGATQIVILCSDKLISKNLMDKKSIRKICMPIPCLVKTFM